MRPSSSRNEVAPKFKTTADFARLASKFDFQEKKGLEPKDTEANSDDDEN